VAALISSSRSLAAALTSARTCCSHATTTASKGLDNHRHRHRRRLRPRRLPGRPRPLGPAHPLPRRVLDPDQPRHRLDRRRLLDKAGQQRPPVPQGPRKASQVRPLSLLSSRSLPRAYLGRRSAEGEETCAHALHPPTRRLGLGAQPASLHKQLAEDRKIASRLLRGRNLALGDDGSHVATTSATASAGDERGDRSSSSDDDESRSRAVGKGKARAPAASSNPFVLPSTATSSKSKLNGTPAKAHQPLFNEPSPAKPSPSASTSTSTGSLMAPIASSSSFYTPPSTSTAVPSTATTSGAPLTKNQRKKERERLKREDERRRREEESRAAALAEEGGAQGSDAALGRKRARGEDEAPAGEDEREGEGGMDEDEARSRTASPAKAGGAAGEGGDASPKKRRKKKKRKSGEGAGAREGAGAPPLLNLAPLVGAGGA